MACRLWFALAWVATLTNAFDSSYSNTSISSQTTSSLLGVNASSVLSNGTSTASSLLSSSSHTSTSSLTSTLSLTETSASQTSSSPTSFASSSLSSLTTTSTASSTGSQVGDYIAAGLGLASTTASLVVNTSTTSLQSLISSSSLTAGTESSSANTSSTSTSSTSLQVGDYVAEGLGLVSTTATTPLQNSSSTAVQSTTSLRSSNTGNGSSYVAGKTTSIAAQNNLTSSSEVTSRTVTAAVIGTSYVLNNASSSGSNTNSLASALASGASSILGNATQTGINVTSTLNTTNTSSIFNASCSASWDSFLSAQIDIGNSSSRGYTTYTSIIVWTTTTPASTWTSGSSDLVSTPAVTTTITNTDVIVRQSPPSCPEPTVGSELCQSLRDAYVSSSLDGVGTTLDEIPGYFSRIITNPVDSATMGNGKRQYDVWNTYFSGGYYAFNLNDQETATWTWPTQAWFGPGCTLGCGQCSVQGGTVQLLYWPQTTPQTAASNLTGAAAAALVTTVTNGVTLTSPTVYVAYTSLYAFNACSQIGPAHNATIVPIPPEYTLSSIWAAPQQSAYDATDLSMGTASFNFTDIQTNPVPYSIYTSQPWCADYAAPYYDQLGWGKRKRSLVNPSKTTVYGAYSKPTTWDCPYNQSYAPIIMVPSAVLQSIQPMWSDCVEAYGGVYDPPKPLTGVTAEATPTTPSAATGTQSSTAVPASSVQPTTPTPTAAPVTSSVTSASADKTSPSAGSNSVAPATSTSSDDEATSTADTTLASSDDTTAATSSPYSEDSSSNNDGTKPSASSADPQPGSSAGHSNDDPPAATTTNALSVLESALQETSTNVVEQGPTSADDGDNTEQGQASQTSQHAATQQTGDSGTSPSVDSPAVSVTIGSSVFTQAAQQSSSVVVLANPSTTLTLSQAGAAVTVGTYAVSADPSNNVVVGSGSTASTVNLSPGSVQTQIAAASGSQASITVGSLVFTKAAQSQSSLIVLANPSTTVTLTQGGGAVAIGTNAVSADPSSNVVVGTGSTASTVNIASNPSQATSVTIGSLVLTQAAQQDSSVLVLANPSTTLSLTQGGAAVSVGTAAVSAASSNRIVIGSGNAASTVTLDPANTSSAAGSRQLTIGSQVLTEVAQTGNEDVFAAADGSQATTFTITQGGSAVSIGSQVISAAPSNNIVIGTGSTASTVTLHSYPTTAAAEELSQFAIGSLMFTEIAQTGSEEMFVAASGTQATTFTLTQGGSAITVGSNIISAGSSNRIVVGTGSTANTVIPTPAAALGQFTIGSRTFDEITQTGNEEVFAGTAADGQLTTFTLTQGGAAVTVGSDVLSAGSSDQIVVGTGSTAHTVTLTPAHTTTAASLSQFTVSSEAFTEISQTGDLEVFAATGPSGQRTTFTVTKGGAAVTVGSDVISLASNGGVFAATGSGALSAVETVSGASATGSSTQQAVNAVGASSNSGESASATKKSAAPILNVLRWHVMLVATGVGFWSMIAF